MKSLKLIVVAFITSFVFACGDSANNSNSSNLSSSAIEQTSEHIDSVKVFTPDKITASESESVSNNNEQSRNNNVGANTNQTIVKHYTNSAGERVQSPTYYNTPPAGACAECRDGTYSFSRNRRGTCSHHGGVKRWLK